ncbi:MAG: dynamin family protein [Acidimicrobiia bacterium]|nr:dynamin family protein [Acidimicrobiia bacterium]
MNTQETQDRWSDSARSALDSSIRAVRKYRRLDLADALYQARARLDDPGLRIVVAGEFKQGKSSLVNALLRRTVCAVDDDIATVVPTYVSFAAAPAAVAVLAHPESEVVERMPIPLESVAHAQTEAPQGPDGAVVRAVEIGVPAPLLHLGMTLVDTPGVGGLSSAHGEVTLAALRLANAMIFVSDSSAEYSAAEMEFLEQASQLCPTIIAALTKVDISPHWRHIQDLNARHLERRNIDFHQVATSAALRWHALSRNDAELDSESGLVALEEMLRDVARSARHNDIAHAGRQVAAVGRELTRMFQAERLALSSASDAASLAKGYRQVASGAAEQRLPGAPWRQLLEDGATDLASHLDFELRAQLRKLQHEADDAINAGDPADIWPEFQPWLARRVARAVMNNHQILLSKAQDLVDKVSDAFSSAAQLSDAEIQIALPDPAAIAAPMERSLRDRGFGHHTLDVLKGSYSGVLMFGMLGTAWSTWSVLHPLPLLFGALVGGNAIRDVRSQRVATRRTRAQNATTQYLDDTILHVGKSTRDAIRQLARQLRDELVGQADRVRLSAEVQAELAQQHADGDAARAQARRQAIDVELGHIAELSSAGEQLARLRTRIAAR